MTLTCGVVVVELRGFEPLTPCMPCHPHRFKLYSAALLGTASALVGEVTGQGAVVRREAGCGIDADNLLTAARPHGDRLDSILERLFGNLLQWGPGMTRIWAGRSRRR